MRGCQNAVAIQYPRIRHLDDALACNTRAGNSTEWVCWVMENLTSRAEVNSTLGAGTSAATPEAATPPVALCDLLVLGTGRSGTSMTVGLLRNSGYYHGDNYIKRSAANPTGFYEDSVVNRINSHVINRMWALTLPRRLRLPMPPVHRNWHALWLAAPKVRWFKRLPADLQDQMLERFAHRPFCYKDPRFSVTLPYWRPFLPAGTRFIVTFRDPQRTASSMVRQAREGLKSPIDVGIDWGLKQWRWTYDRLLHDARVDRSHWFFLNFDDLISGRAVPALEAFIGTKLDASHIDRSFSRQQQADAMPSNCKRLWTRLIAESEADVKRCAVGVKGD
jgi:hypothetical protein